MSGHRPILVKRSEAMGILGVGWRVFAKLVQERKVTPRRFYGGGRAVFVRSELEALELSFDRACETDGDTNGAGHTSGNQQDTTT